MEKFIHVFDRKRVQDGGVTVAFQVAKDMSMKVGVAVCKKGDCYGRKNGRERALDDLATGHTTIDGPDVALLLGLSKGWYNNLQKEEMSELFTSKAFSRIAIAHAFKHLIFRGVFEGKEYFLEAGYALRDLAYLNTLPYYTDMAMSEAINSGKKLANTSDDK